MSKLKFTDVDKEIYFFIVNHKIEYQNGPTLQEIADHMNLKSISNIRKHFSNLEELGLIRTIPGKHAGIILTNYTFTKVSDDESN